jgi:hypothetical protein
MRFMIQVRATADSEAGTMPGEELLTAMGKYNEELVAAGIMKAGEGLHPTSRGVRVHFSGKDRTVSKGPFPVDSVIAGFWIWECASLEEAIEWVKKCPNPMLGPSDIEIRKVFEAADFGDAMTPEMHEREEKMRKELGT